METKLVYYSTDQCTLTMELNHKTPSKKKKKISFIPLTCSKEIISAAGVAGSPPVSEALQGWRFHDLLISGIRKWFLIFNEEFFGRYILVSSPVGLSRSGWEIVFSSESAAAGNKTSLSRKGVWHCNSGVSGSLEEEELQQDLDPWWKWDPAWSPGSHRDSPWVAYNLPYPSLFGDQLSLPLHPHESQNSSLTVSPLSKTTPDLTTVSWF